MDIKNGRTVKGVNFVGIRDAGDPIELAKKYAQTGADELVFLDITATVEKRKTIVELVTRVAAELNIPFTVGGGISSLEDAAAAIKAGADKVSINSAAVKRPELISEIANEFGSQCVVLAIDTKFEEEDSWVYTGGGRYKQDLRALKWALRGEELGAGEILLTSMNSDGTKAGFALPVTQQISSRVNIPVIASGGAGQLEHFTELFESTEASAALAAGIFHFGEISVPEVKHYLFENNIPVRTYRA